MANPQSDFVDLTSTSAADWVGLSLGKRAIELYTGREAPEYRQLYKLVLDGKLTAVQVRGRWRINVRRAAEELGLA